MQVQMHMQVRCVHMQMSMQVQCICVSICASAIHMRVCKCNAYVCVNAMHTYAMKMQCTTAPTSGTHEVVTRFREIVMRLTSPHGAHRERSDVIF